MPARLSKNSSTGRSLACQGSRGVKMERIAEARSLLTLPLTHVARRFGTRCSTTSSITFCSATSARSTFPLHHRAHGVCELDAMFLALVFGPWLIRKLRELQMASSSAKKGRRAQEKAGTPTMVGVDVLSTAFRGALGGSGESVRAHCAIRASGFRGHRFH